MIVLMCQYYVISRFKIFQDFEFCRDLTKLKPYDVVKYEEIMVLQIRIHLYIPLVTLY